MGHRGHVADAMDLVEIREDGRSHRVRSDQARVQEGLDELGEHRCFALEVEIGCCPAHLDERQVTLVRLSYVVIDRCVGVTTPHPGEELDSRVVERSSEIESRVGGVELGTQAMRVSR